ncbi:unnamed protein product [Ambrosiozyma monospora]|uniref:Unnamed protein product n=1 Tax=Ambrosiozyma monospora TaxID=43982 RepID=A0ACB5T984_AMBMO|nr:unnamed protein product [Ambrosiozyma monospora]
MVEESLFVLAQYPFLCSLDDQLADLLNGLVEKLVNPLYESCCPSIIVGNKHTEKEKKATDILSVSAVRNDTELIKLCNQFLSFNGVKVARSSSLFGKLVRVMSYYLDKAKASSENTDSIVEENESDATSDYESVKTNWLQFFRKLLYPAFPFLENTLPINEAFSVLKKHYPLQVRYNLYGEFQMLTSKNVLEIQAKTGTTEKKTKDILKRLSLENLTIMARQLFKLSFGSPLIVTLTFLSHLESYSSLTDLLVECSKFFNEYTWDVLTFQLLNKLNGNRVAMQGDGLNYMQWLQNLTSFIGKIAKKANRFFQLGPLLQFVLKSLNTGDTDMVILLKELIGSMSGIQPIHNLNARQVTLLNSETGLRRLIYMTIQDKRISSMSSAEQLLRSIISEDSMLSELFILLCGLPDSIVHKSGSHVPLKILNQRCDELSSLVHTFTTMVDETLGLPDLEKTLESCY